MCGSWCRSLLETEVEGDAVGARRGRDRQGELPPAAHVEADAFDFVEAIAEIARHARPRWQSVSVLRHPAVHRDLRAVNRLTLRVRDRHLHRLHRTGLE